jgi:HEAT repeat protein
MAAVKAVLVHARTESATSSIAALIAGGRPDDALDLAMLTKQFGDAARMLIDIGMIDSAIAALTRITDEDEARGVEDRIIEALKGSGDPRAQAGLLIARRRFQEAAACLRQEGLAFVPDAVAHIREEGGLVWIENGG